MISPSKLWTNPCPALHKRFAMFSQILKTSFSILTSASVILLISGCSGSTDQAPKPVAEKQVDKKEVSQDAEPKKVVKKQKPFVKLTPAQIATAYEVAEKELKNRNAAKALVGLNKILTSDPKHVKARKMRMNLLSKAGALQAALSDAAILIQQLPDEDDVKLHNIRGFIYLSGKNYDEAIKDFDAAIRIDPEFATAYNNRGLAYVSQARFLNAIDDFNKAIQINPDYVDAHNNRGFALLQNGSHRKALDSFTETLRLKPDSLNALSNRGTAHIKIGNLEEAVEDFEKAIALAPYSIQHHLQLRSAHKMMNNDEAIRKDSNMIEWIQTLGVLNAQIKKSPKNLDYRIARTEHLIKNNDTELAMKDIEAALEIEKMSVEVFTLRGRIHFIEKDYKEARKDCEMALKIQEENSKANSLLGDICLIEKDYDNAIKHFLAGRRFDSSVAQAYLKRSEQLKKAGKKKQAKKDRETALALDPNITTAKR